MVYETPSHSRLWRDSMTRPKEDEFDDIDDNDLLQAASHVEDEGRPLTELRPVDNESVRPVKRRRLNGFVDTARLWSSPDDRPWTDNGQHGNATRRAPRENICPSNANGDAMVLRSGSTPSTPARQAFLTPHRHGCPRLEHFRHTTTDRDAPRQGSGARSTSLVDGQRPSPNSNLTPSARSEAQLDDTAGASSRGSSSIRRPPTNRRDLRQLTLFGRRAQTQDSMDDEPETGGPSMAIREEPPTHHRLNDDNLPTWTYPTNLGSIRDYQFNITQKALFHNLLVALPTGLGKTYIAATVMLNWFRWTTTAQIVFVAPTKPLVAQQIDACFRIVGIPRSETTLLTGSTPPGLRAKEWSTKRVFFMTPQTMVNDLATGMCDPKRIVCVIVDEAHRATGNYAYVEMIKFIRRFNRSFRVLALTATPGSSVEAVQQVIDGLDIARVEIRTEESLDLRRYVHRRDVETAVFDYSEEIISMRELFSKALAPVLDQLNQANAYWVRDPMSLTAFGLTQARQQWMNSEVGRRANMGLKGKLHTIFALLASLAHAIALLNYHGIGPFFHYLAHFQSAGANGAKTSKYRKQVLDSPDYQTIVNRARTWVGQPDFVGHPKLEYLQQVVLDHFIHTAPGTNGRAHLDPPPTRVMIFAQFRDSAEEIVRVLKRNEPLVRPHVFVGQAAGKGSSGMSQKAQLDLIQQFKQGKFNTLVATCVGEEGLDIGEVDLIVCYDSSSSPIRMLQRMGRTGRRRAGNIILLLMRGKEEDSYASAKDNYERMQQMITDGSRFTFHADLSPRILPRSVQPVVDKREIEIPPENSQGDLPEPRRRGRIPKRPPKKFRMPDGVETGFVNASRLGADDDDGSSTPRAKETELVELPTLEDVLLTAAEERDLQNRYQSVHGDEVTQTVVLPRLDAYPEQQRSSRPTGYISHGRATTRMVKMLNAVHDADDDGVKGLEGHLHPHDCDRSFNKSTWSASPVRSMAADASRQSPSVYSASRRKVRSSARDGGRKIDSTPLRGRSTAPDIDVSDDSMADFIVDDDVEEEELVFNAPSSSTLLSSQACKPFYQSPKRTSFQILSQDDLPDVSILVGGKVGLHSPRRAGEKEGTREGGGGKTKQTKEKQRRAVVEDSDDE